MKNYPIIKLKKYSFSIIFMIAVLFSVALPLPAFAQSILQQLRTNLYEVTASANLLDATITQYSSEGNDSVDRNDAGKIPSISAGTHLGMLRDGKNLVIERRHSITVNDSIFYNLMTASKRDYRFEFIAAELDADAVSGFLEDAYLKTSSPVHLNDTTTLDFTVNTDEASSDPNRFRLVFNCKLASPSLVSPKPVIKRRMQVVVNIGKPEITVYPNPVVNRRINIKLINQAEGNYALKLIDNFGHIIIRKQIYLSTSNVTETIMIGKKIVNGTYHLEVLSPSHDITSITVIFK